MKTYWDLPEADRAKLSADDVQRYVDAELMLKGVLKVGELVVEPVPPAPEPTAEVFTVRAANRYGRADIGIAFGSLRAAQAFLQLEPLQIDHEYLEGATCQFTRPIRDAETATALLFTESEKDAHASELRKAGAIKAANAKRAEAHATATTAQTRALAGMWEDWNEVRERDTALRGVVRTFGEYKEIAEGDDGIALTFLAKVYPEDVIKDARERYGLPSPPPPKVTPVELAAYEEEVST